jgi:hypothetical protein
MKVKPLRRVKKPYGAHYNNSALILERMYNSHKDHTKTYSI